MVLSDTQARHGHVTADTPTMTRQIDNPQRGCGTLERSKAYIRGVQASPGGVLPSFVRLDPPLPFREQGSDGGFTRGYKKFDGLTTQIALSKRSRHATDAGGSTDFLPEYPGNLSDQRAVENMIDAGLYPDEDAVPTAEHIRHSDRIFESGAGGDHFGEIPATQQTDLLMRAGKTHYPDPDDFVEEAIEHGISKAIPVSQNQAPPEIMSGVTRCWIVHPDTDVGWAIIGYAYLSKVVYTMPEDRNVPKYVQDYASAGGLEVVDIEEPPEVDDDQDTLDNFTGYDVDGDDVDSDLYNGTNEPGPPDSLPGGQADTVIPRSDGAGDVQSLSSYLEDNHDYNELKALASAHDCDVGAHPSVSELTSALCQVVIDHPQTANSAEEADAILAQTHE